MSLWGKTGAAGDKPKYLTAAQKANTVLTAEGWEYTHPNGNKEILVALGSANLGPVNTVAPTVTGTPQVGQVLTSVNGTWTGTGITYTRQWQVADTLDGTYTDIAAATGTTYTVLIGQLGKFIRAVVTATSSTGANSVASVGRGPVVAA